jgi:hypothetical protein
MKRYDLVFLKFVFGIGMLDIELNITLKGNSAPFIYCARLPEDWTVVAVRRVFYNNRLKSLVRTQAELLRWRVLFGYTFSNCGVKWHSTYPRAEL